MIILWKFNLHIILSECSPSLFSFVLSKLNLLELKFVKSLHPPPPFFNYTINPLESISFHVKQTMELIAVACDYVIRGSGGKKLRRRMEIAGVVTNAILFKRPRVKRRAPCSCVPGPHLHSPWLSTLNATVILPREPSVCILKRFKTSRDRNNIRTVTSDAYGIPDHSKLTCRERCAPLKNTLCPPTPAFTSHGGSLASILRVIGSPVKRITILDAKQSRSRHQRCSVGDGNLMKLILNKLH